MAKDCEKRLVIFPSIDGQTYIKPFMVPTSITIEKLNEIMDAAFKQIESAGRIEEWTLEDDLIPILAANEIEYVANYETALNPWDEQ